MAIEDHEKLRVRTDYERRARAIDIGTAPFVHFAFKPVT